MRVVQLVEYMYICFFRFCLCCIGTVAKDNLEDRAGSSMMVNELVIPIICSTFLMNVGMAEYVCEV